MPLKLAHFDNPTGPKGQVAVLNKWADWVETQLHATQSKIFKVANTAVTNIPATPAATTSVGDSLTHGDPIWWVDSAWMMLRDDFNNPSSITGPSQTWGAGLNWTVINGGTFIAFPGGAFPMNGVIAFSNSATASQYGGVLYKVGSSSGGNGFPLLDYPGWKTVWEFQIIRNNSSSPAAFSWTKVSFYVGFGNYVGSSPSGSDTARPPYFMGLRYDTDTTSPAISDTHFVFEYVNNLTNAPTTRNNTQGTTFGTGITVTEGRKYRFEMSCFASGKVLFFLTDGVNTSSTTMSVSPLSFGGAIQPNFTSSNGILLIDWSGRSLPLELGTNVTISGGSISAGNGTFVHSIPRGVTNEAALLNSGGASGVDSGATTSFYPAWAPLFWFGNDSEASPVGNSKGVLLDMFALVWNKGLITGGAKTNSLLARYY